jgi:hypothetical protein
MRQVRLSHTAHHVAESACGFSCCGLIHQGKPCLPETTPKALVCGIVGNPKILAAPYNYA